MVISKDVKFDENALWNWKKSMVGQRPSSTFQHQISKPTQQENVHVNNDDSSSSESDLDVTIPYSGSSGSSPSSQRDSSSSSSESPIRKIKLFFEVYERCNLVIIEPKKFHEASKHDEWISTMKEEIKMIEKNDA